MLATARSKVEMTSTARLLVALLLAGTAFASDYKDQPDHETINWDDYVHDDPVETAKFRKKVVPLIHDHVFTHWEQYREQRIHLSRSQNAPRAKVKSDLRASQAGQILHRDRGRCRRYHQPLRPRRIHGL